MELWYSRAFHDSFYMFSEYLGCGRYGRMRTLLDIDMTRFISDLHFASGNYRGGAPWMLITPSCFGQWVAFGRRVACKLGLGRLADALGQLCGMGVLSRPPSSRAPWQTKSHSRATARPGRQLRNIQPIPGRIQSRVSVSRLPPGPYGISPY